MRFVAAVAAALALSLCVVGLARAQAYAPPVAKGRLIGQVERVRVGPEDTLVSLAMRHGIGFVELRAANPDVDIWLPQKSGSVLVPSAHIAPDPEGARVVVNRAELRLYHHAGDGSIRSAPLSLGRDGRTPLGRLPIGEKRRDPAWYPTAAHRAEDPSLPVVVAPGPGNPLGRHALRLGHTEYLLHGTDRPASIGREVSRGCIRLAPHDAAWLFERVTPGDEVLIVDAPLKMAIEDGRLWIEVAPSPAQVRALDAGRAPPEEPYTGFEDALRAAAGDLAARIDWQDVARIARERRGIPEAVTPAVISAASG